MTGPQGSSTRTGRALPQHAIDVSLAFPPLVGVLVAYKPKPARCDIRPGSPVGAEQDRAATVLRVHRA